jgi:hypothetical protein
LNALFQEAHNAMIYYYSSIDDLLNLQGFLADQTNESFKKIQNSIKDDIICRYRSILDDYSYRWRSVKEIGGIHFSKHHRLAPSLEYGIHSLVIARYVREWMQQISDVIINLEMKYF